MGEMTSKRALETADIAAQLLLKLAHASKSGDAACLIGTFSTAC
jgi:hypothetical protein